MAKFLGVKISADDLVKITHAVGVMSLLMLEKAELTDDIKEAIAYHELHGRLIRAGEESVQFAMDGSDEN